MRREQKQFGFELPKSTANSVGGHRSASGGGGRNRQTDCQQQRQPPWPRSPLLSAAFAATTTHSSFHCCLWLCLRFCCSRDHQNGLVCSSVCATVSLRCWQREFAAGVAAALFAALECTPLQCDSVCVLRLRLKVKPFSPAGS